MKKLFAILGVVVVALHISTPVVAQNETPVAVDTIRPEVVSETVAVFGEIVSRKSGAVQVAISAPVADVHVRVGDRIEQGDLIATLDSTMLELQKTRSAPVLRWRNGRPDERKLNSHCLNSKRNGFDNCDIRLPQLKRNWKMQNWP